MNLQQLEYIVAVDTYRHFGKASEACFVTQPTLSMMIQKLEEELEIRIFNRDKQHVAPTEAGKEIIEKAKSVLHEVSLLKEISNSFKGEIKGELKIGIIPTVAPYLLPLFLKKFLVKHSKVKVKISEFTTELLIEKLERNIIDVGILASPLNRSSLIERSLYMEELVVFASDKEKVLDKKYILQDDIDLNHLWLLEEGHCLRSQIIKLCELRKKDLSSGFFEYSAGSIDSLIKMVEQSEGITILPELAVHYMNEGQKDHIRHFKTPVPVREICLVTHKNFVRVSLLESLRTEILEQVKGLLSQFKKKLVL